MEAKFISLNYECLDSEGNLLDKNPEQKALTFITGCDQVVLGLEENVKNLNPGDKKAFTIVPQLAYGEYDPEFFFKVPRYTQDPEIEVGEFFEFENNDGDLKKYRIVQLDNMDVYVDANHPLAGKELHYKVEITEVREPSLAEEKAIKFLNLFRG
jgi:FKBP-type peptidyl-prolyl cis-trans isomerase SlyD